MVDNSGQWTFLEERMLRELGAKVTVESNQKLTDIESFDAVILSGGASRIKVEELGHIPEIVDRCAQAAKPLMGICVGHQYLAIHFGGSAGAAETPEFGGIEMHVLDDKDLFQGLPGRFMVWESHNDEVKELGKLQVTAESETCPIQALRHPSLPIFGVQFHPEVHEGEFGPAIFTNFLSQARP